MTVRPSTARIWTGSPPPPSKSPPATKPLSESWPIVTAESLSVVREPLAWCLSRGRRAESGVATEVLLHALGGPRAPRWQPPAFLRPHQREAARRIVGSLEVFGGAILGDAVGLGKTYVALAVATRHRSVTIVVPSILRTQWTRTAISVGVDAACVTHEALSRGRSVPRAQLVIVDEAHHFRNDATVRYDRLARTVERARVLLLTATPVVNRARDVTALLRLFLADGDLASFGRPSISSLSNDPDALATAIAPVTVARSPRTAGIPKRAVPAACDHPVVRPPPVPAAALGRVAAACRRLTFPTMTDRSHAALLHLHLLYRLAPSAAAFAQCLGRHERYLDRAIEAATRGERLSRTAARLLFDADDDFQLALPLDDPRDAPAVDVADLRREQARLAELRSLVAGISDDPKLERLRTLLASRTSGEKTIVFTCAVATAHRVADGLGWKRIAVATGTGATIASGRISLERALALFAPAARGAAPPGPEARVDVLVATDLVSEGLDLQDASGVVHYDLPWTPRRLQQRVGRIARLGSRHRDAQVWWFAPPRAIDRTLRLVARLADKADLGRDSGVPVSSRVGRATMPGRALEQRERLAIPARRVHPTPVHSVVRGPPCAVYALVWSRGPRVVPTVWAVTGDPPRATDELSAVCRTISLLQHSHPSPIPPSASCDRALRAGVGKRLRTDLPGPRGPAAQRLVRKLIRRAVAAAAARRDEIPILDAVLAAVHEGLPVGGERTLEELLDENAAVPELRRWRARWHRPRSASAEVRLWAALYGDGSAP